MEITDRYWFDFKRVKSIIVYSRYTKETRALPGLSNACFWLVCFTYLCKFIFSRVSMLFIFPGAQVSSLHY